MKKLEVVLRSGPEEELPVGTLVDRDHRVYFEYSDEFLERSWELSPWKLPAVPGLQEHRDRSFGPLPGLFDDSLPDGWGMLLMDRRFQALGQTPANLSPLDRLAYLGTRTMGALTYRPPEDVEASQAGFDLGVMAQAAREVLAGSVREVLPALQRAGGSPGGARPKVLVGVRGEELCSGEEDLPDGFEHWMVKFPAREDGPEAGRIELAYATMARRAGIEFPATRRFEASDGGSYFGVRRFDRQPGNRRLHVHTLGGLLHADFRIPGCDYDHLLRVARALTHDHRAVVECFRRMVFNVVASNRDDHVKNFAFLMDHTGSWSLSPAYDLVPASGPGGEHQMTIDGEGREPTRDHCFALGERHGVSAAACQKVLDEVQESVAGWAEVARAEGLKKTEIQRITKLHRCL